MALKFRSCDVETMVTETGFVGAFDQALNQDLTGVGCAKATWGIFEELCVPTTPVPGGVACSKHKRLNLLT